MLGARGARLVARARCERSEHLEDANGDHREP
jgi:hypothetical protein